MTFIMDKIYIDDKDMEMIYNSLYVFSEFLESKEKKEIVYIEYNISDKNEVINLEYSFDNVNKTPLFLKGYGLQKLFMDSYY